MILIRYFDPDSGAQLGLIDGETIYNISDRFSTLGGWLRYSIGATASLLDEMRGLIAQSANTLPVASLKSDLDPNHPHWLPPIDEQDVWAAGVTYERSRNARQEESIDGGDVYARVYGAERPELFFKARGRDVVGMFDRVGIRRDASWSVPEPELALVINPALEIVGFTVGNDMSSRDIEGANPLYLPQAKMYTASCALGPGILIQPSESWLDTTIHITITRGGQPVFAGEVSTARIVRTPRDLVEHLGRALSFPHGTILLTGTGIVPPNEFTLAAEDEISIHIEGIGTLHNTVKIV
ncbi:MAG: fumarylacetoacetate hydrolase family protein [Chloroflexota bacterium]|nr:fumarylacetoacetate hydrolase family protein [Chloroflexota bacterium]